jgi:uncharacterized protein (TIGR03083 family)
MPLSSMPVTDTRAFYRPLTRELVTLLRTLPPDAWDRPTIAGSWLVRDVVAHLVDTAMRRLSFQRDGHPPPQPDPPPRTERDFVEFINELNATWVSAARRVSPRLLTDVYASVSADLAAFVESLPLDTPALFPVSWAGEEASAGWFDIGREFTEQWHHQMQVRDAVGAAPMAQTEWLRAVLQIAIRGLPHAYRTTAASSETMVTIEISGPGGGTWTLRRDAERWSVWHGAERHATAKIMIGGEQAWKLLFNALNARDASRLIQAEGDRRLVEPFLRARSVIV